jgi:hypothetical protein
MSEQGELFRDNGAAAALAAQEEDVPGWAERAFGAIVEIACRRPEIHTDDVTSVFREPPTHFNAWGAVWMRAIKEKIIVRTGNYRRSSDPKKHAHVYPVYRSRLFR